MQEIISGLVGISGLIEKGGIIAVLLVIIGFLVWDRLRLVKELTVTYRGRERARIIVSRYKAALDARQIVVDLSDISSLMSEESAG